MRALLAALCLAAASACATAPSPRPTAAEQDPRQAARSFILAVEEGRWSDAFSLLSARWREQLTPARLQADWEQGGVLAADHLERARLALRQPAAGGGDELRFPIGEGKALRLVRERGGWRVDGLE